MTHAAAAEMANPFTPWQRAIARILPWFDPEEDEAKTRRTEELVDQVGKIDSIRIAYRDMGNRPFIDRRQRPR